MAIRTYRYSISDGVYSKNGQCSSVGLAIAPGSIVHMTDTHNNGLHVQTGDYINAIKSAWRTSVICHTGDIFNDQSSTTFPMFGGNTFVCSPGNHDVDPQSRVLFGNAAYNPTSMPWLTGLQNHAAIEAGHYYVSEIGGMPWSFVALPWAASAADLLWAKGVIQASPMPVVLLTHAYLYRDGTRYDWRTYGEAQEYNPHYSWGCLDGQEIWDGLVNQCPNIKIVLCGHDVDARVHLTSTRTDGTQCLQICSGAQAIDTTRVRTLYFWYDVGKIIVRTWSVLHGEYYIYGEDDLDLEIPK